MALTTADQLWVGQYAGQKLFTGVVANFNVADLQAAAAAIDAAFDTTLSAAVTAMGGSTTVINGLVAAIPSPFSGATNQQKAQLACWVLLRRAGLL